MSRVFVVVSEARADYDLATELADRVLYEKIEWLDKSLLDSRREWVGNDPDGTPLTWKAMKHLAAQIGFRADGHFEGQPGKSDAYAGKRAINYILRRFKSVAKNVDAILLIRDLDRDTERRAGLNQACYKEERTTIILGLADIERESWVLSGFEPVNADEEKKLNSEIRTLAFHPCKQPHRLRDKHDYDLKSPKRVLKALTDNNKDRERKCWIETSLTTLEDRGRENGLADYIEGVRGLLVPLILSKPKPAV